LVDPGFRGSIFKAHGQLDSCRFRGDLEYIFTDKFSQWTSKRASRFAARVGDCRQRIYEWHKKWIIDGDWRPRDDQNRRVHHQLFTPEEEAAIREFIVTNYVIPEVLFTNENFRNLAMRSFLEKQSGIYISKCLPDSSCDMGLEAIRAMSRGALLVYRSRLKLMAV
jgi:hypothetical protein